MAKKKRTRGNGRGSIYKRTPDGPWWLSWWENGERQRQSSGTTDKRSAEAMLEKIITGVERRRRGVDDAAAEAVAKQEHRPIGEHVEDFHKALAASAATETADLTAARVRWIIADCKAKHIRSLTPSAVHAALKHLRDGDNDNAPRSLQTCQHYLRAAKQFSAWLVRDKRAAADALAHMKGVNVQAETRADLQHVRRALSDEEAHKIIRAAERGPTWIWRTGRGKNVVEHVVSGPDRAMLYRVALGTGFRLAELASLTAESFDLDSDPPTAMIEGGYSKHRRTDVQPLPRDLAERLRSWLAQRPSTGPLWDLPRSAAAMLKTDLATAGVPYADDAGRVVDFHAFRHSYVSRVVASGASVKVAQELARHSTPALTIGRYAHARLHDLSQALDALPDFTGDGRETEPMRATGTDGNAGAAVCAVACAVGAPNSASERTSAQRLRMAGSAGVNAQNPCNPAGNRRLDSGSRLADDVSVDGWGGRAAEGTGLENR